MVPQSVELDIFTGIDLFSDQRADQTVSTSANRLVLIVHLDFQNIVAPLIDFPFKSRNQR